MVLVSAGGEVSLEDAPGMVFHLLEELGVVAPEYEKLRAGYYGTLTMSTAQVAQLRRETLEARARHEARRRREVMRARKIHSSDPKVVDRVVDQLLAGDPWLVKLDEIVGLCEATIARGDTITCVGD